MFYFKDKFNVFSQFDWEEPSLHREVVEETSTTHVHHGYDYTLLDEQCPESGIYVQTKNMATIPGFSSSTHLREFERNYYKNGRIDDKRLFIIDDSPAHAFLKPNTRYEYIKLSDHLIQEDNDQEGLYLKSKGFHYVLSGDFFYSNGKVKEVDKLYVHERYIRSEQMDIYLQIDQNIREARRADKLYTRNHAEEVFEIIKKHKGLEKIFDPEETSSNTERLCISTEGKDPNATNISDRYEVKEKAELNISYPDGYMNGGILKMEHDKFMTIDDGFDLQKFRNIETHVNGTPAKPYKEVRLVFPVSTLLYDYIGLITYGIPGNNGGTFPIFEKQNPEGLYPYLEYLNELELIITHEYIHAMQSLLDPALQGDRDIGQVDEKALGYQNEKHRIPLFSGKNIDHHIRRSFRELFAYHFCIFPNKIYDDPADDPVFKFTDFVRGKTARFGGIREFKVVFWVFRAIDYADYLKGILSKYYNKELVAAAESASDDIYKAKRCYEHKGYSFPNKEARGKSVKDILSIFSKANDKMLEKEEVSDIGEPGISEAEEVE